MGSPTTNYGWTKPTVGADTDAWGGELNTDLDGIDSTVFAVSGVANAAQTAANAALPKAGGTMTGPIVLAADPAAALQPATKQYVDALPVAMNDNRIVNGDMRIDQRNNGASGTATGVYTVDRWKYYATQTSKGTWSRQSSGSSSLAFPYCLGFTSSSAYAPIATDTFQFFQAIEADMVSDFAWGSAGAQSVTLSFWVQSTLTGTFGGMIANWASTRSYPFSYSISSANNWVKISITIPGDTSGTWVMSGNAASMWVVFDLGSGSSMRAPANAWTSAANVNGATGAVNVVATNGAGFNVTGVKLETGTVATPYPRQSLAKSLADCQRYYYQGVATGYLCAGQCTSATTVIGYYRWPVVMRANPTCGAVTAVGATLVGGGLTAAATGGTMGGDTNGVFINLTGLSGLVAGNATTLYMVTGSITASAEL